MERGVWWRLERGREGNIEGEGTRRDVREEEIGHSRSLIDSESCP
jgi:hypothetical protein